MFCQHLPTESIRPVQLTGDMFTPKLKEEEQEEEQEQREEEALLGLLFRGGN